MKKILITGANSYIGMCFEKYIYQRNRSYTIDTLDMIDGSWRNTSFSGYDCVLHVAGIAHQKETKENAPLYYQVNRDLAVETARKAKADGVGHFIFMSSMSVYGMDRGVITPETQPTPKSNYGKSKFEAEQQIGCLRDDSFVVSVLRPPMVYGKNCRGNFQTMIKLVQKSPIFPVVNNRRSMISITNLCAFITLMIEHPAQGVFFPQNHEFVNTTDMAKQIAAKLGKRIFFSRLAGLFVYLAIPLVPMAKKAFANLTYCDCEQFDYCYCEDEFVASIRESV